MLVKDIKTVKQLYAFTFKYWEQCKFRHPMRGQRRFFAICHHRLVIFGEERIFVVTINTKSKPKCTFNTVYMIQSTKWDIETNFFRPLLPL